LSTFFNDELYNKTLSKTVTPQNTKLLTMYVQKFMDKNSEILTHNIPSKRLFFYPADMKYPFDLFGVSIEEIDAIVDKVKRSKECFGVINQVNFPFNFLMINLIRFYELHNDKNGLNIALMYITLYQYSALHAKYYKFLPNEDCMQFTFNRISDKYYFRKYQSVFKAIFATTINNHESMKGLLKSKEDIDILKYLLSLRNRLNNQMKNFTNEYMEDFNKKNYLNLQQDSRDEENYYETTNMSGEIVGVVNKAYNRFATTRIDPKLLRISCQICKAEQSVMKQALENIKDNEMESIRLLILAMIQLYISNEKNSIREIGSQKFFTWMVSAYSKSNSKNETSLTIKNTLDKFLMQYCNRYSNTEREATKVIYRKALFIYFVLLINHSKNN
jgi:hypothetical protein